MTRRQFMHVVHAADLVLDSYRVSLFTLFVHTAADEVAALGRRRNFETTVY